MVEQAQNPTNTDETAYGKNPPNAPFKNVVAYLDDLIKSGGATGTFDDLTKAVKSGSINSSTFRIRTAIMKKFKLIRTVKNTYTIEPLLPSGVSYKILHHDSKSNFYLQVTDYCNWAIYRKWEKKDRRSHDIIRSAIRSEFDIFQLGATRYY